LPLLLTAWFVYASFIAILGLWFSLVSRTSLRATIWTLLIGVALNVGHWFVMTMCVYVPLKSLAPAFEEEFRWLPEFEAFGLTPPLTLTLFAFQGWEFEDSFSIRASDVNRWYVFGLGGIACWAVATALLWVAASRRLRVVAGRVPVRHP